MPRLTPPLCPPAAGQFNRCELGNKGNGIIAARFNQDGKTNFRKLSPRWCVGLTAQWNRSTLAKLGRDCCGDYLISTEGLP